MVARRLRIIGDAQQRKGIGAWDFKSGRQFKKRKCLENKGCPDGQMSPSGEKRSRVVALLARPGLLSHVNFFYRCRFPLQKGNFYSVAELLLCLQLSKKIIISSK